MRKSVSSVKLTRALMLSAAVSVCISPAATAQIDEIIVTSQKREQSLQSIPISVTAFDQSALESLQIDVASDLQFNAPNVNFSAGQFGGANLQIRGIGSATVGGNGDGGVGVHINDAPMRAPSLIGTEYLDIERIELLRGPQGTLFGRNATGGVFNMITKKPTDEFEGTVTAGVGNFDYTKISGVLNVPLTDNLAVRIAGADMTRDGYTENLFDGSTLDGRNQYTIRGSARWTPGDSTTIDLMYSYFSEDSSRTRGTKQLCHRDPTGLLGCLPDANGFDVTNGWAQLTNVLTSDAVLGGFLGLGVFGTGDDPNAGQVNPKDLRVANLDFLPEFASSEKLWIGQLEHEFDRHTFTAVGSIKESDFTSKADFNQTVGGSMLALGGGGNPPSMDIFTALTLAGLPTAASFYATGIPITVPGGSNMGMLGGHFDVLPNGDAYDFGQNEESQWSFEARLRSDLDGPFNYLIGGLMMHQESESNYDVVASVFDYMSLVFGASVVADGFAVATPHLNIRTPLSELDSWGIFGEAYFDVGDDIRLTAGLRLNNDEKFHSNRQTLPIPGAGGAIVQYDWDLATPGVQFDEAATLAAFNAAVGTQITDFNEFEEEWQELTGRLLFEWTPDLSRTDDTLIYASYSRGYKGGGFNVASASNPLIPSSFDPEFINAYEVGMKNTMLNNTLTANLTAFQYDYTGYQISKIIERSSVNENIDAKIWGLEGEFLYAPNEKWLSNLTVSFMKTEVGDVMLFDTQDPTNGDANVLLVKNSANAGHCVLDPGTMAIADAVGELGAVIAFTTPIPTLNSEGTLTNCAALTAAVDALNGAPVGLWDDMAGAGVIAGVEFSAGGNQLPTSPEWSFNVGVQRTFFPGDYEFTTRVDYYKQADMFSRPHNTDRDAIDSWGMLNMSATLIGADSSWEIKAYVQNVLDDDNITGHYLQDAAGGLATNVFILEPRTYGLTVTSRF